MSLKFESEAEIAEKRKVRDEEWAKVRKESDPIQAPEPVVDNRSLYDRLQEQKNRAKEELEESKKLKHLVKLLEEDECDFLDQVDEARVAAERKKRLDEAQELLEFRDQVAKLREQEIDNYIKSEVGLAPKANNSKTESPSISVGAASSRNSQTKLLSTIVKRKNPSTSTSTNTTSPENNDLPTESKRPKQDEKNSPVKGQAENSNGNYTDTDLTSHSYKNKGSLICIGEIKSAIRVLPGLGSYSDSDSSNSSSDSDLDDGHQHKGGCCSSQTDLCGRRIQYVDKKDK